MDYDIEQIGSYFGIQGEYQASNSYGSGHINDTFLATYIDGGESLRYIFQRINHYVFKDPTKVMDNIERVTSYQREKNKKLGNDNYRNIAMLKTTLDQLPYYRDDYGNFWRIYPMIENARTYDIIENKEQAYQAAKAFGDFQKAIIDLPGERLHETIPDFHNSPLRLKAFEKVLAADLKSRAQIAVPEIEFILSQKSMISRLDDLFKDGKIPERITHNDTKLNNVLIDDDTGKGVCVIDLDTVMPGLALYDFGDMIRTGTSPVAEDEIDLSKVTMQMEMFKALAGGYLSSAAEFLTELEMELLPFSGKLITITIAIRFLTDFLDGDFYFKTHRENHNLERCRTQIALFKSIEAQEDEMLDFVKKCYYDHK